MAYVHFELPDALVEEARAAGISIEQVAHEALNAALGGRDLGGLPPAKSTPQQSAVDASGRYRQGREIGELWARTLATVDEMAEIINLRSRRWRDFAFDTTSHSLGALLSERGEVSGGPGGMAWMPRDAFSEGLVDGVVGTSAKAERP